MYYKAIGSIIGHGDVLAYGYRHLAKGGNLETAYTAIIRCLCNRKRSLKPVCESYGLVPYQVKLILKGIMKPDKKALKAGESDISGDIDYTTFEAGLTKMLQVTAERLKDE